MSIFKHFFSPLKNIHFYLSKTLMRTGNNHFGKKEECELNEMKMRENYDNGGLKT